MKTWCRYVHPIHLIIQLVELELPAHPIHLIMHQSMNYNSVQWRPDADMSTQFIFFPSGAHPLGTLGGRPPRGELALGTLSPAGFRPATARLLLLVFRHHWRRNLCLHVAESVWKKNWRDFIKISEISHLSVRSEILYFTEINLIIDYHWSKLIALFLHVSMIYYRLNKIYC
jgi:hypothetical protein